MNSALSVFLPLVASAVIGAQSFQGGLRGTVRDAQGIIPGVTVALMNDATNVARETVSNNVREYSFPAVDSATYTIKAGVQGCKTFERKGIRIGTQSFITLDVVLEIGAIEEACTRRTTGGSPSGDNHLGDEVMKVFRIG